MNRLPIRIATRSSRLALWQANHIAAKLREADPDCEAVLVHVSTSGDRIQSEPLHQLGSFGVFTREVQRAVLADRADLAVHSLKDLPTDPVDGLVLAAVPNRASPFDALVLPCSADDRSEPSDPQNAADFLQSLPDLLPSLPGRMRIGTGSIRRRAQLLHNRPDWQILDVRGNVETRLAKLDDGQYDALVLAAAGLQRLELSSRITVLLKPPQLFPAVGQGALGMECRSDDRETRERLAVLSDAPTLAAVLAERTLLAELRAGCHAPVGVFTVYSESQLTLDAVVLSANGRERITATAVGSANEAVTIGKRAAAELLHQGADRLVEAARLD